MTIFLQKSNPLFLSPFEAGGISPFDFLIRIFSIAQKKFKKSREKCSIRASTFSWHCSFARNAHCARASLGAIFEWKMSAKKNDINQSILNKARFQNNFYEFQIPKYFILSGVPHSLKGFPFASF
jgi:hypothetical protein